MSYEPMYMRHFKQSKSETENRMADATGSGGTGAWESVFDGDRISM